MYVWKVTQDHGMAVVVIKPPNGAPIGALIVPGIKVQERAVL